jgi:UDP-GlcNAc:undecaprenyl-phosphate GlcNAc-1-phosphate transferase
MSQFVFIAIAAGLIAFAATPVTLLVARRIGLVAIPNARKTHSVPTPLLGGVAIWVAFVVSLLIFGRGSAELSQMFAIIIGGTLISIVGFIDDRIGLGPVPKMAGQIVAALVLILGGVKAHIFSDTVWYLNVAVTILWIVGICNATNYMDNMDGLAAGVSAVAAGSFLVLAALNGQVLVASLAAALLGACAGFLVYNFQPAISFMGDTGSLLLGFMLAVLGIKLSFPHISIQSTWMAPIIVLGLPLFDTALVTISRFRRGISVLQGGADHSSHRLARLGLSNRRVVIALYTVGASLGLLTVFITQSEPVLANLMFAGLVLGGIGALWLLEATYALPAPGNFRPDLRLTFIGGGDMSIPLLEGAASISRTVSMLITASPNPAEQLPPIRLVASLPYLAETPEATRAVLTGSAGFITESNIWQQIKLAQATLILRGKLIPTLDEQGSLREEASAALRQTDLILIGGDLRENVLPTLMIPEVNHVLRRSKRARVLAHADPAAALAEIERVAGPGLITHIITSKELEAGQHLWHTVADLRQGKQVADALNQIWLRRTKARGAPQPISGSMYG